MIVIRVLAGLGNQLFQYALGRSLEQKGYTVYLDIRKPYQDYENKLPYEDRKCSLFRFHIRLRAINLLKCRQWTFLRKKTIIDKAIYCLSNQGKWPYRHVNETGFFGRFNKGLLALEDNCYLAGTFQNENYFKDIRELLLQDLTLKKELKLPTHIVEVLNQRIVVGVHIRRGDYVTYQKKYGLCSAGYYQKAMNYMREIVKEPVFFFFSDDIEYVKEEILCDTKDEVYYVSEELNLPDYEELMVMSMCKHNIIANSSFGWWGAWLNQNDNKIVIAPKIWRRDYPSYDIVPPEWIKI